MKLEEARAVRWPFREFKGQPIGELLDNGQIVLRDLGFAVERAYNPQVREASKVLLLHALSQFDNRLINKLGPPQVLSSQNRTFAERRQIQYAMLLGFVPGIAMGVPVSMFITSLLSRRETTVHASEILNTPQRIIALIIVLIIIFGGIAIFFVVINWIMDRIYDRIKLYRKGQKGEERVLDAVYATLDSNWWVFRNLELPGQRNGDIDFVLVGPSGIWALEAKAYAGQYQTTGDRWQIKLGNRWIDTFTNPSRQAKRNAAALAHILQTQNIKQWVQPAVIWVNQDSQITVKNSAIHVWQLNEMGIELQKLSQANSLHPEKVSAIVTVIKDLHSDTESDS